MARHHDYTNCKKGDDCRECKIEEQSATLQNLAKQRAQQTPPTNAIKRAALNLLQQQQAPKLAMVLTLTLALFTGGCVSVDAAIAHAKVQQAANEGHAADDSLPVEAREIGRVNGEAWAAQVHNLGGD